ncbi:MAG: hypothetical protein J6K55_12285 [Clostridia bacterium]|nr:hypothetical protein [Clostridia bacterium]
MKLTTSKGLTYNVDWADGPTITSSGLLIQMQDSRSIAVIAAEFEGNETIRRESETEGNKEWHGYTEVMRVARVAEGVVTIALAKPVQ